MYQHSHIELREGEKCFGKGGKVDDEIQWVDVIVGSRVQVGLSW